MINKHLNIENIIHVIFNLILIDIILIKYFCKHTLIYSYNFYFVFYNKYISYFYNIFFEFTIIIKVEMLSLVKTASFKLVNL